MSEQGDFKDPFNFKYFVAFLAVFVGIGCLNAIMGVVTSFNL